jgi:hypothetical protein
MCCAGSVSISTPDAAAPVFLAAGEQYPAKRNTRFRITFQAGPRNEWLADMGIAVVAFLPRPHE